MTTPPTFPESQPRRQARAVLTWLLGHPDAPVEDRFTAGDALTALQEAVPAGAVLAPLPQTPASLDDARRLLQDAVPLETTARGTLAVSLALRHLRHLRRGTPATP